MRGWFFGRMTKQGGWEDGWEDELGGGEAGRSREGDKGRKRAGRRLSKKWQHADGGAALRWSSGVSVIR